ncbi:MAG: tRNA (adenosine(37)-N6)-threonylcarbamoyltransferase complex transferase subunit TsaD, partial [Bacteroidota bacterium]
MGKPVTVLGIESSCDDTAAAVLQNGKMLANIVAGQAVHAEYGGVVPELASRAHQQHIVPVVDTALKKAGVTLQDLDAIAFTNGPGLLGSLLVGNAFAKGLALGLNIPLIAVNHMQAHVLAHFIEAPQPAFPFLCLTVSGGHTQIVRITDHLTMEVLGSTIDDAAGEAFDKIGKILGLPYPAGPHIDRLAKEGNPNAFTFARPKVDGLDFSFSGLKTSVLYFLRDQLKTNPTFAEDHRNDLCASVQAAIIDTLMHKLKAAAKQTGIHTIAIAGGVSANSGLRQALQAAGEALGWEV